MNEIKPKTDEWIHATWITLELREAERYVNFSAGVRCVETPLLESIVIHQQSIKVLREEIRKLEESNVELKKSCRYHYCKNGIIKPCSSDVCHLCGGRATDFYPVEEIERITREANKTIAYKNNEIKDFKLELHEANQEIKRLKNTNIVNDLLTHIEIKREEITKRDKEIAELRVEIRKLEEFLDAKDKELTETNEAYDNLKNRSKNG